MQDLPSYLSIYALDNRPATVLRRFHELVTARLAALGLLVAVVKTELSSEGGRATGAGILTSSLAPDGSHRYSCRGTREQLVYRLGCLGRNVDLVLLETGADLGLVQLLPGNAQAAHARQSLYDLSDFAEQPEATVQRFMQHLQLMQTQRPVWACILIGGRSSRMGRPKHLLTDGAGLTWLERTVRTVTPQVAGVALSGQGEIPSVLQTLPRLPDIPDVQGPLTGILSAMRWQPDVAWLLLACDLPEVSAEAVAWLLAQQQPGQWGCVPATGQDKRVEPLFARYEPQCAALFEAMNAAGTRRISTIVDDDRVRVVRIPDHLRRCWQNVNTPEELHGLGC